MSFNIFDSATRNSIRVGYIDPDRGYLTGKSIYEANVHASKNPGAVFILETRDRVRYLTINEVNKLTVQDITPDEGGPCEEGIKGLNPLDVANGDVSAYGAGIRPIVVSGNKDFVTGTRIPRENQVKVGASGGTQLTAGGSGGRPVTAGGKNLTSGGNRVKSGATGGVPVFLGGTGGTPVFLDKEPLTINGKGIFAGGEGGLPVTFGGRGGQRLKTDGAPNACESKIFISGGGGVGAFAVPVIGTDGSVLAAIVTDGGFGYKTPPQSRLFDSCRRGVGTVLKTYLGNTKPTTIYYDQEDDFEVYDLTPPFTLSGYGKRFGPDGNELGDWDPNLFASLESSPIQRQIRDYQDFLKQLTKPWWHTRKETPLEVAFREKTDRVKHDVQHWAWGGKIVEVKGPPTKNDQLEELEFEVYTQGGNQADRDLQFTFTSEDGSHKFQFKAPEFKEDRKTKVKRKVKRNTVYNVVASGKYKGKGVEQGLVAGIGRKPKEIKENTTGSVIFADFLKSANDNDDLQVRATQGTFKANKIKSDKRSIYALTYKFESGKDFKPTTKQKKVIEDSFMNRYAISPTPPSNVPGTDYAGRVATFIWEEDFPISGDYKFRGMADNIGRIFIDNELILEEKRFKGDPVKVVSKYIEKGVHEIKVELFNIPIKEKPKPKQGGKIPVKFDVYGQGNKSTQLITYVFTSEDGKHSFTFRPGKTSGGKYSYSRTENVLPNTNYRVKAATSGGRDSGEYEYPIEFEKLNSSNRRIEVSGKNSTNQNDTLKLRDGKGSDANVKFTIVSTSPGVSAKFSDDGRKLLTKGKGNVSIRLKYDDNPNYAGEAVRSITIGGVTWRKERKHKGEETKTLSLTRSKKSSLSLEQGCLKRGSFTKGGKGIESSRASDVIFADITTSSNDNDDMQIRCGTGEFTPSNKRRADGRGSTYDLTFKVEGNAPRVDGGKSTSSQKTETIFNTADYINKADRKLWRTNVYGRSGFLSENGVCPFDTKKPLDNNPYAGTHVIRWEHIDFPNDGNYEITVDADDSVKIFIGNREGAGKMGIGNGLKDIEKGGDEVIIENGMNKQTYTRFFKKGKYRIRTELTQIPGGVFSFDKNGRAGGPDVTARFIERGGQKFLKVEGTGSAKIHFRLRTDDDPGNSGVFASKIKIGKGDKDSVELRRSQDGRRLKEKETINGSAFFEAGREYLIQTFNSNRDTGSRIKNKGQTIEYDDNISNGFDENADLTITKITDQQKPKVKGVNPMALAIDIKAKVAEEPRISVRSWQQNPMGAAFTIDAPLPPIPQEPPVEQEGRCPNNPLWSSRFAGGSESWWPVTHPAWSKFTNRFAMSPLPPLSLPNSDGGGGIVYSNTWQVDFPYDGFYGFKGTGDNKGRILIDGQEVYRLRGFKKQSPEIVKRKITEGNHEVTLEIENQDQRKRKKVTREFFNTQKWQKRLDNTAGTVDVKFRVTTAAKFANSVNFVGQFSFGKSYGGPQLNESVTKTLEAGKVYDVVFDSNAKGGGSKNYPITVQGASSTSGRRVRGNKLEFDDDATNGFDVNATLKIESTSPGVDAKFNGDGSELIVKGKGDVTLKFSWDDKPSISGLSVGTLKVAGTTFRQRGTKGNDTKTVKVSGTGGGGGSKPNIRLRNAGETVVQMEEHTDNDWKDLVISSSEGRFFDLKGNKAKFVVGKKESGLGSGTVIGGVTYTGPELFNFKHPAWSELMNKISVSPYTPPLNVDNPNINGTFTLKWSGVKFSENGRYDIAFQADNIAKLFIGGKEVQEVRSFRGEPGKRYVELSRGTYDVEIQLTNVPNPRNIFNSNPSGVALKITKELTIVSSESPPWTSNPVGASAMIIPPPCPKVIEGTGFVERIEVIEPGNGHPPPEPPSGGGKGIPVTLQLVNIIPDKPGIGYKPGDKVIVEVPGRPPIEFEPELDKFGRITKIPTIPTRPEIPPPTPGTDDPGSGAPDRSPTGFDIIGNTETQILQVKDLPGQIGVADDTGVLIPLVPSGGSISEDATGVKVPAPGPFYGFTEFPNIYPTSDTGLGFRGRPVFEVVVVPENILPDESVLQVVDIPGIRKTGYVNGKPYYGQVFAKDGNLYAGISETIGQLVPVYATLQESILNRQTVESSAILRTGTEVSRNNPTLNIPDNLI
jgi:hypothetical protein